MLHAAPASLFFCPAADNDAIKPPSLKNLDSNGISGDNSLKRITFLVNIWLNHRPLHAKDLPMTLLRVLSGSGDSQIAAVAAKISSIDSVNRSLFNYVEAPNLDLFQQNGNASNSRTRISATLGTDLSGGDAMLDLHSWSFLNGGTKYKVFVPLPTKSRL